MSLSDDLRELRRDLGTVRYHQEHDSPVQAYHKLMEDVWPELPGLIEQAEQLEDHARNDSE